MGGTTVIDNLLSTSPTSALSANQGRILNEKIGLNIVNVASTDNSVTVNPGDYVVIEARTNNITININNLIDTDKANEFYFEFDIADTVYSYSFVSNDTIRWKVSSQPSFFANKKYVLKILNGLGSYEVWN